MFIGRAQQLRQLSDLLERVRTQGDAKPGRAILVRGRRRVGKSRLVEQFVQTSGVPHLFYAATGRSVREELSLFAQEVAASDLPGAGDFQDVTLSSWDAAFRLLANAVPASEPCVLVFDELPYLVAGDPSFEASLQTAFDRHLSKRRVLLIGVGSDLAMMELLNSYGRPFHQRATEMIVPPLSPFEVGAMLSLAPADAFDAYLVTGGLPLILDEWPTGMSMWDYLRQASQHPTSALLVSAERALAAEFPTEAQARGVLSTIGGDGERTFTGISKRAGINATALTRATDILTAKRLVTAARPLSTRTSKETRYRVNDPYLRFWLSFLAPQMQRIERGGGAVVVARIEQSWERWRGRVIEPVIHEGLERLALPYGPDGEEGVIGGYWVRTNTPEIDIVIADKGPVARAIYAVGSIKWKASSPFDGHDLGDLIAHRGQLPGATVTTPLVVVTRSGSTASPVPQVRIIEPSELLDAWK
jgi:AAA+ ATPase superfamily predicted ATPase